ncbi:MAG: Fe-S protein assembly chaperone HscA [Pseudomonadota bacterium]|nr:Fe-S protein assembly chaperone HscA [Pseudomonadota bacterium]
MALLQISEPGESPDPHRRRHAVGIDLGTTHSLVATVRSGAAECLADAAGRAILPSAVRYLASGAVEVGQVALDHAVDDPRNTIVSVKRLMGRGAEDVSAAVRAAYDVVAAPGMIRLQTVAGAKSPVEISAAILAALRHRAEDTLDADLFGAVVTVPAYFDEAQRQATKDAAELAGLDVLRLISEPTAAAIAYGLDNASEGLYAIYDFGGGTFDVSLLRMTKGVFEVIATGGDSALGGDDIDAALSDSVLDRHGAAPRTRHEQRAAVTAARAVKEALSGDRQAIFTCQLGGVPFSVEVTRNDLDRVARPFVERTLTSVRQVLRDARLAAVDVDGVVMVGGSTLMPIVQDAVAELFGRPPLINLDPEQVVAIGAAIQAEALAGQSTGDGLLLLDVTALSLGLETMGGLVERIIPRNSPIPTARTQEFTTYQNGQTAMSIHVVQGERELVADCRSLGRFELRGIPPMVAGAARIRVAFVVDADGLLNVSAREETTGLEASITVKPSYGLADDDVARMLSESFGAAAADMTERSAREARVDAERLLAATKTAIAADADLLSAAGRQEIESLSTRLCQALQDGDRDAIEAAQKALALGTETFAADRMNRGIRQALAGRRLEDV